LTRGETLKNGVSVQMQLAEGLPLISGGSGSTARSPSTCSCL